VNHLPVPPLLVITDRRQAAEPLSAVIAGAISGGARWISIREKDLPAEDRRALFKPLLPLAMMTRTRLMVHDDLETAAALGLAGLHLPAGSDPGPARTRLGPGALIGVSAHDTASAWEAARLGADYVTLSPIFLTDSKPGYGRTLGLDALAAACRVLPCPVLALGGIDAETLGPCLAAGAAGAAVMGGIMRAQDPAAACRDLVAAWKTA
jgi:thiamine-phosphate pyrophosphorylase